MALNVCSVPLTLTGTVLPLERSKLSSLSLSLPSLVRSVKVISVTSAVQGINIYTLLPLNVAYTSYLRLVLSSAFATIFHGASFWEDIIYV